MTMLANTSFSLDASTLIIVASCITTLLGSMLLFVWSRDRIRALAWWGAAYLLGGFSVALWTIERNLEGVLPAGFPNAMLFIACGMMWNAARLFHGRPIRWLGLSVGGAAWLAASQLDSFAASPGQRLVLSGIIIATYTFLTAHELWLERRKTLIHRRLAILVPAAHGAAFLIPIVFADLIPEQGGILVLATGWIAIFALESLLYVIGAAFIVLVMSEERKVRMHKAAAFTDPLTGALNRRGFYESAAELLAGQGKRGAPVSVLLFDLDHFKSINDRFGHATGDEVLKLFATTARSAMRADDTFGRLGGEEFAAILAGGPEDAAIVAERVRFAFEVRALTVAEHEIAGTVSVGLASAVTARKLDERFVETLIRQADEALYRAKRGGRNRIVHADRELGVMVPALDLQTSPSLVPEAQPALAA